MKALETLRRGCVELVSAAELERKLSLGRPLRVKLGVDPTSPDLHLGHTVVLNRLRAFQELGHTAVLIIGDFTARIGDPSGRDATRPTLSESEIQANARTYQEQAFKVLLKERTELRFNSEWLEPFMRKGLLETLKRVTVGQLLQREDFAARQKAQSPITLLEILYPVFQGYDSVAVKADVELGGNDQVFNLLMGREMLKDAGLQPQVAMTVPLLVGLDGVKKMSKSYGNAIALNDPPREMFGKLMKISDEQMLAYYELLTQHDLAGIRSRHPMEAKKALAQEITGRFHGDAAARQEREFFEKTFSQKEIPENIEIKTVESSIASWSQLLAGIGAVPSRKQAQRLISQGALKVDGAVETVDGRPAIAGKPELTVQLGKHRFYKIRFTS